MARHTLSVPFVPEPRVSYPHTKPPNILGEPNPILLRSTAKAVLEGSRFVGFLASACLACFRTTPIERWPGWVGTVTGVKVPRRTVPNRTLQPQGGANIAIIFELLQETAPIQGDIAECGVFRGETLVP